MNNKWILIKNAYNVVVAVRCPNCKRVINILHLGIKKDICPNCGAEMKEGK